MSVGSGGPAERHLWMPYTQMKTAPLPVRVVATEGVRLHLADGRTLIDGLGSWWTAVHGYNHPHLLGAVAAQLAVMPHVMMGGIAHPQAERLAGRLAAALPGDLDHVFFVESGSVAVEVALKIAVQWHLNQGRRGRHRFLSFARAYHGDTLATMAVCDPITSMHAHFEGWLPRNLCAELPRDPASVAALEDLVASHRHELAAVVVEPLIQGAGGFRFHEPEVLRALRRLCDEQGLLLIFDEIATGFGRTGSMFACAQAGVVPDVIALGKALTGGVAPLAATVARTAVFAAFWDDDATKALMHGPTFMGHALGCAAANASLDLFETEPRLAQARAIEGRLRAGLEPARGLPGVVDVRAKGAVGVIQVEHLRDVEALRARFVDEGVWLRPFGDAIYATPPLVIEPDDLDRITAAMVRVVAGRTPQPAVASGTGMPRM